MRTPLRSTLALLLASAAVQADELSEALDELRVQALVATLRGRAEEAKDGAAEALAWLGETGTAALVRALGSDDAATRARCLDALRKIKTPPASVLACLVTRLGAASDERERREIAEMLVLLGDVAQQHAAFYLSSAAGNGNMPRGLAYRGLARMGPTEETIPLMVAGLADEDPEIQAVAAEVLAPKDWWSMRDRWHWASPVYDPVPWHSLWTEPGLSRHREAVLERLVPLLRHPHDEVRALAANGLGRADAPLPDKTLQALRHALNDTDDQVRWRAAASLARLVEGGFAPLAVLLSMLQSQDDLQQSLAAEAAWRLGDKAAEAVPALRRVWEAAASGSVAAKEAAAATLGRLGAGTDQMVGQLAAAYCDIDPWEENVFVLARLEELAGWLRAFKGAYRVLVNTAKGNRAIQLDGWHSELDPGEAVRALEAFPEHREETINLLRQLLDEGDFWEVRYGAAELMHRLGVPKEAYEWQLGKLIDMADGYRLVTAAQLLHRADPRSQRAVPRLLRALAEPSTEAGGQSWEMAGLLAGMDGLPPTAKEPLLRAARRGQQEAIRALGRLAQPDDEVLAFLWAAIDEADAREFDKYPNGRESAADALACCVRSPEDIERLIVRAHGLRGECLSPLTRDPARADLARDVLARMAKDDARLPIALAALEALAPESDAARDARLRYLRSRTVEDVGRSEAWWWLSYRGGPDDRVFVPQLARGLLATGSGRVSYPAPGTLQKIASTEDLARIAAVLEEILHSPETKREALASLGAFGPKATAAIPAIRALETDRELAPLARKVRAEIER